MLSQHYSSAIENYTSGYNQLHNKNYLKAIQDFTQALELLPDLAKALYWRGYAYIMLDQPMLALIDLNKAIDLEHPEEDTYYLQAICHNGLGDHYLAIQDIKKITKFDRPEYYSERGWAYLQLGMFGDALLDYENALQFSSGKKERNFYLYAEICLKLERFQQAHKYYTKVILLNHTFPNYYIGRGIVKFVLGDNKLAIEDFTQAILLDSSEYSSFKLRSIAYRSILDFEKALADVRRSLQIKEEGTSHFLNTLILLDIGKKNEAITAIEKAINLDGNLPHYEFWKHLILCDLDLLCVRKTLSKKLDLYLSLEEKTYSVNATIAKIKLLDSDYTVSKKYFNRTLFNNEGYSFDAFRFELDNLKQLARIFPSIHDHIMNTVQWYEKAVSNRLSDQ